MCLTGEHLAGFIDAAQHDQATQFAGRLVHGGDGGQRIASCRADLFAQQFGSAGDVVGSDAAQGLLHRGEGIAFHGVADIVGGKVVEQGLHPIGGCDQLLPHHFLADHLELAGGQVTFGGGIEGDERFMRGAFLAVECAYVGQQALHLFGDCGEVFLPRKEGDAAGLAAGHVRPFLAWVFVRHADHEGNRVADLEIRQFLAVIPIELLFAATGEHGFWEIDGDLGAAVDPVGDRGGADAVVVVRAHREFERASEHRVQVLFGRGDLDAGLLIRSNLQIVARAGEFEAMILFHPSEAVALRSIDGFIDDKPPPAATHFKFQRLLAVAMENRVADRLVEFQLPTDLGVLRNGECERFDRFGFTIEIGGKSEADFDVLDARRGDHADVVPVASGIARIDPVAEIARCGIDLVLRLPAFDRQFHLAGSAISGLEQQLGGLGNNPRYADKDLCSGALLDDEIGVGDLDLGFRRVGDRHPWRENAGESGGEEGAFENGEKQNRGSQRHRDPCRDAQAGEADDFFRLQIDRRLLRLANRLVTKRL